MLAGSCIWSTVNKYQNGTAKVAKKAFNMGRSGTMVTELLSSYWRAHLVEPYCTVSNISDTNWNIFGWCHHLATLQILKTNISGMKRDIWKQ